MGFPIRTCVVCSEEFELKPDKPGFANRCPSCSVEEEAEPVVKKGAGASSANAAMNAERRKAIRDLLYRKDS